MKKTQGRKKAPAKPDETRTPRHTPPANIQVPNDFEDLLLEMVINSRTKALNGTDLENLLYNATPGLAELGYGFGFTVGRAVTLKLGVSSPVTAVLDKLGLHDTLYYPFNDKVIITSKSHRLNPMMQMGRAVHIYESGIIAGYLSTSTGMQVSVSEKRCIYDGYSECQFVGTPASPKPSFSSGTLPKVSDAIAHNIADRNYVRINSEYYRVLAYLPLMDSKLSDHILKIMAMSGEKLGKIAGMGKLEQILSNISNYYGIKDVKIERKGMKRVIKLRYETYNSVQAFVALPAAMIMGFANATGNKANIEFATNKDGSYTTIIEITKKRI